MPRTKGATNLVAFTNRDTIETSTSSQVRHVAKEQDSPLEHFKHLLRHQKNFLNWVDSRHEQLRNVQKELAQLKKASSRGPKDAVYRKYRWYSESLVLLEAINNFEVFYKRSLIELATCLKDFIPVGNIRGSVDGKVIWSVTGSVSAPSLIFEHQLFHDLGAVDKATDMLISSRRYNVGAPTAALKDTVKALQAVFQIRHTLSHNGGLVTESDRTKLKVFGYDAPFSEIIDPTKDKLGESIFRLLKQEANEFTSWLRAETKDYLRKASVARDFKLPSSKKIALKRLLGGEKEWEALPWSE